MAGRASAGMVKSLSALTGVRTGKVKILTNIAKEYPQIGYIYSVVRNDTANDPDMKPKLQQFVTASIKASRFIMDHPDQAVQILEKKYPDLDKGLVADVIHSLNDDKVWGINGSMFEHTVADNLEKLKENEKLNR